MNRKFLTFEEMWSKVLAEEKKEHRKILARFHLYNKASSQNYARKPILFLDPMDPDAQNFADQLLPPVVYFQMIAQRMGLENSPWSLSLTHPQGSNFTTARILHGFIFSSFKNDVEDEWDCEGLKTKSRTVIK